MDIFFNELSVKLATNDNEAYQCLEDLAKLSQLLKKITESLNEDAFRFRRKEDFGQQKITNELTILEFLQSQFDFSDPVYIFLLGIFDSPYISEDDPQRSDYDLTSITINHTDYEETGIAAAYLKGSLVISLDSDAQWDTCLLNTSVNKLTEQAEIITEIKPVRNASKKQHIMSCHLPFLSTLYDWPSYKPMFDYQQEKQSLLPLPEIYVLLLETGYWPDFYNEIHHLSADKRVDKVLKVSKNIAEINQWERASNLEQRNGNRVIYIIPESDFIIGVDTQHGEFEIHVNRKGNNHLGAIAFDGENFKARQDNRSLAL